MKEFVRPCSARQPNRRLSVFKSLSHIYAQLIDDTNGRTLIAASSTEKAVSEGIKHCGNVAAAKKVGANIAERALGKNIKNIVFDRERLPVPRLHQGTGRCSS